MIENGILISENSYRQFYLFNNRKQLKYILSMINTKKMAIKYFSLLIFKFSLAIVILRAKDSRYSLVDAQVKCENTSPELIDQHKRTMPMTIHSIKHFLSVTHHSFSASILTFFKYPVVVCSSRVYV